MEGKTGLNLNFVHQGDLLIVSLLSVDGRRPHDTPILWKYLPSSLRASIGVQFSIMYVMMETNDNRHLRVFGSSAERGDFVS